jgi:hypothetical protein
MPGQIGVPGSELKEVLAPGRATTEAARALGGARRRAGLFPYQWMYPGPNSKHVLATGATAIIGDQDYLILDYRVPEGLRFSLRAVVFFSNNPTWSQGDGNITFNLNVTGVGPRPVEWLTSVVTQLGNLSEPWPIMGRLEFQSRDLLELTASVVNVGGDGGFLIGRLIGHTYPNSEAGEG